MTTNSTTKSARATKATTPTTKASTKKAAPAKKTPAKTVTAPVATSARRQPGVAASRTPKQQARFVAILTEAAEAGNKWHGAAKTLTAEAIPTSKGGGWYFSTVQALAASMGIAK